MERVEALELVNRQLQHALDSRIVIEQAKGMLAVRVGTTLGEAFEMMRSLARSRRRRLRDVAEEVVANRGRLLP